MGRCKRIAETKSFEGGLENQGVDVIRNCALNKLPQTQNKALFCTPYQSDTHQRRQEPEMKELGQIIK